LINKKECLERGTGGRPKYNTKEERRREGESVWWVLRPGET